jgi:hypothetical protein
LSRNAPDGAFLQFEQLVEFFSPALPDLPKGDAHREWARKTILRTD